MCVISSFLHVCMFVTHLYIQQVDGVEGDSNDANEPAAEQAEEVSSLLM